MDKLTMKVRGDGVKDTSTLEIEVHRFTTSERLKKTCKWFGIFKIEWIFIQNIRVGLYQQELCLMNTR